MLNLEGKYEEAMNYLIHFKSDFIDKPMIYNMIVENTIKAKKNKIGLDLNSDNTNLITTQSNIFNLI